MNSLDPGMVETEGLRASGLHEGHLESGRTGKLLSAELANRRILLSRPHSSPETMLAGSPVKLSLPQAENGCDVAAYTRNERDRS